MSTFLAFPNELVPMGASTLDVHNKWKSNLTSAGWQVKAEQTTTKPYTLDMIPPSTEAIGNADAYEFLRFSTNDTVVSWQPLKHWNRAFPQVVRIYSPTAGAVLITATLAGAAVTYQGLVGNTVEDNLMGLLYAIKARTNAAFTAYAWTLSFPAPQNANDATLYIVGTKNAYVAAADAIAGTNCTANVLGDPVPAGYDQTTAGGPPTADVTIDLTNGFIYYMQICSRGLGLAIRTNSGYFGPIHACYSDHAKALAATPKNSPNCTPIELVVGVNYDANNTNSWFRVSSLWGMPVNCYKGNILSNYDWALPGGARFRDTFHDVLASTYGFQSSGLGNVLQIYGSNLYADDDMAGNDFQIHRLCRSGFITNGLNNGAFMFFVCPPVIIDDWYKFRGTAVDENLVTVADTVRIATLAADIDLATDTIAVDDLSLFQPAGSVVLGKEWIDYTGKSAATGAGNLTGCTRGTWSTTARKHYAGERVSQGLWFVKINGGALFAGYTKPSA